MASTRCHCLTQQVTARCATCGEPIGGADHVMLASNCRLDDELVASRAATTGRI